MSEEYKLEGKPGWSEEIFHQPKPQRIMKNKDNQQKQTLKIEKGIPIPAKRNPITETLKQMQVGDSVLVDAGSATAIRTSSYSLGVSIVTRKDGDKIRVWRVA